MCIGFDLRGCDKWTVAGITAGSPAAYGLSQ